MINKKLTDLAEITSVPDDALIHVVDTSNSSQDPAGSSFKAKKSNLVKASDLISQDANNAAILGSDNKFFVPSSGGNGTEFDFYQKKQIWIGNAPTSTLFKIGVRNNAAESFQGTAKNLDSGIAVSRLRCSRESATTVGSVAEIYTGSGVVYFTSWQRGFRITIDFNFTGAAGMAHFTGIHRDANALTNIEPSTQLRIVGIGFDSTDTNLQIMHNDNSGVATKVDLGVNFPVQFSDDNMYRLILEETAPNSRIVDWEVRKYVKGVGAYSFTDTLAHIASGQIITDITPDNGTNDGLAWRSASFNRATTNAVTTSIFQVILEDIN